MKFLATFEKGKYTDDVCACCKFWSLKCKASYKWNKIAHKEVSQQIIILRTFYYD